MAKKKKPATAATKPAAGHESNGKERGWKSSAIRELAKAQPELGPTKISKTLTEKFGEVFSPSLVSNILGNDKAKTAKSGKSEKGTTVRNGRKKSKESKPDHMIGVINSAIELLQKAGSLEAAQEALATVSAVSKALKTPF